MKQRLSFALAWLRVRSKFLTLLLQHSIHAFDRSITHPCCHDYKSRLSLCRFSGFFRPRCQFKPDLGHDLGIEFWQGGGQGLWMIAIVQQDGDMKEC